jgi:nicotinate-nucleotide pyrophosphorylase (carboxylating)
VTFWKYLDEVVSRALFEDLASGDITTSSTVAEDALGIAHAIAKSPLVMSGGEVFARCFHSVHPGCRVEQITEDGAFAAEGSVLLTAEGPTWALLQAERTALNFLQRLCGVATLTRKYVEASGGLVRICDTRKTTPLLRYLERKAVRDGGGFNHRDNLGSAVLIKDNHIAAAGGVENALKLAKASAPHTSRIEIEVTTLAQVSEALEHGADILLLDNMSDEQTQAAIGLIGDQAYIELSGNMTLDRVKTVSTWGAQAVSVGALTHSAPAADISLRLRSVEDGAPPIVSG